MTGHERSSQAAVEEPAELKRRCSLEIALSKAVETEQQLRGILSMQKSILDGIPDLAWLKDREGKFLGVSQAFEKACGIQARDLIEKTDFDFWPQEIAKGLEPMTGK